MSEAILGGICLLIGYIAGYGYASYREWCKGFDKAESIWRPMAEEAYQKLAARGGTAE